MSSCTVVVMLSRKYGKKSHRVLRKNSAMPKKKINTEMSNCMYSGTCSEVTEMNPKKPNSANRTVVRIKVPMLEGKTVLAYFPGEGDKPNVHSTLYIRPGSRKDLPGVGYIVMPGLGDSPMGKSTRRKGRSKYGVKKPKE